MFKLFVEFAKEGKIDLGATNNDGWNIFHHAVRYGSTDLVNLLLSEKFDGIKIDLISNDGGNALHFAACYNRIDKFEAIYNHFEGNENIEHNLDSMTWTDNNLSPIHCACLYGSIDMVKLLIKLKTEKICGTHIGNEFVATLPEIGFDTPAPNYGNTPFLCAAAYGSKEVVEFLLKLKPDIIKNLNYNALQLSAGNKDLEVFSFMQKTGLFDLKETNASGQNVIHMALRDNHLDIVKRLFKVDGCKELFLAPDNSGRTPLQYVIIFRRQEILELLFQEVTKEV